MMGLSGQYMMVDVVKLKSLLELENDDLFEEIEELNNDAEIKLYDIDKMWDGLHYLLTGVSASQPIEGDKLSESIVGVNLFNSEDDNSDFIAYTQLVDLPKIIEALTNVDLDKLRTEFNPSSFSKAEIYPDIWADEEKEDLFDELVEHYTNLLSFYKKALEEKANVIVSIY